MAVIAKKVEGHWSTANIIDLRVVAAESVKHLVTAWMACVRLSAEKLEIPAFKNTCLISSRYQGLVLSLIVVEVKR
jgi:hypothetical protein